MRMRRCDRRPPSIAAVFEGERDGSSVSATARCLGSERPDFMLTGRTERSRYCSGSEIPTRGRPGRRQSPAAASAHGRGLAETAKGLLTDPKIDV